MSELKNKSDDIKHQKTANTFAEAMGKKVQHEPVFTSADSPYNDYVDNILRKAREYSENQQGPLFDFVIDEIPTGINHPHEITTPIILKAGNYGLMVHSITRERIRFYILYR